ncbi:MAG: HlyC/CorC family transporter [Ruminococcaceae bacterium]|nr:HlyC/CorC family transporter [Oscillospiraceae bacterium]
MEYILLAFLLLGSAFFSGTEIAYTSLSKLKMKREGETSAIQKLVGFIYNHYDYALSTVLVGNNLVNIGATSVATVLAVRLAQRLDGRLSDDGASAIVTIVMTIIILIVGEITPKMVARRRSEAFAKLAAWPLLVLMILFFPVVWLTSCIVNLFGRLWKKDEQAVTITEEEFENLLDTAEDEGVIDESETELLQSALEFTDLDAADILTPRIDVVGFELHESTEQILQVISETQFSRFPVYERTIDHVVGILYVKHLLKELVNNKDVQLQDLLLEPVYIPKTMRLHDIMDQFRTHRTHMVIVADEYGGIMGVVTMEDVLEQLVGEIWDENDDIVNDWQPLGKHRYEASGDMNLTEFFDNLDLDDEDLESDCATLGGWAAESIGAMPVVFDSFDYQHFTILVKHVDDNHRITRLLILEHPHLQENADE